MLNARLARFAFTLSLVIATVIQPAVGASLAGGRPDNACSQQTLCASCGCCEVEQAGEACGCCASEPSPTARRAAAPCHPQQQLSEADAAPHAVGHCLCGRFAPPMHRENDRSRGTSNSELRAASSVLDLLPPLDPARPARPMAVVRTDHGFRSDFSQRVLCVWRI